MSDALARACRRTAEKGTQWILAQLLEDGSFGEKATDLAAYYKLPTLLLLTGRLRDAHRVLDHIVAAFARNEGDFGTEEETRTADAVLAQYPGYMTGWIALGALRAGRFDVAMPAYAWLRGFHDPRSGGARLAGPDGSRDGADEGDPIEVLMTAHLGYAALSFGDLPVAEACGKALADIFAAQPEPEKRLMLRMTPDGGFVEPDSPDEAPLHVVEAGRDDQAFFFVGYPIAFLTQLYRATGDKGALDTARRYADFAIGCGEAIEVNHFAHKVGWAMGLLSRATGDARHGALARAVAEHLIDEQGDDGGWLEDDPLAARLDQSAEVCIWLTELSALI